MKRFMSELNKSFHDRTSLSSGGDSLRLKGNPEGGLYFTCQIILANPGNCELNNIVC